MFQVHFQRLIHPLPPLRENWFLDMVYGLFILTVTVITFVCVVWLKDQVRGRGCTLLEQECPSYVLPHSYICTLPHSRQPVHTLVQPVHTLVQPVHTLVQPVHTLVQPVHTLVQPVHTLVQPVHTLVQPVHTLVQPVHTPDNLYTPQTTCTHPRQPVHTPDNLYTLQTTCAHPRQP